MEKINVSSDELQEVLNAQGHYGPGKWAFSCNEHGDVSPVDSAGYGNVDDNWNLKGKIPLLDRIVELVCEKRDGGGRFYVSKTDVRLSHNHEQVAAFEVGTARQT